jgi:hypothetical protein
VQTQIETARKARTAGHLDDAERGFETALSLSPGSSAISKELAALESSRGELDQAEAHARQATTADPNDADAQALLGSVLEAKQDYRAAATAYAKAAAIDPRPEWRTRASTLADKADLAAIPAEYRDLPASTTLTRGQVAAFLALRLPALIDRAPKRPPAVITDVRTHWAAPWIVPVTRAGVMDVYANHTFQPDATVTRAALAQVLARLVAQLPPARQADVTRWRASRPRFPDLPTGNVNYRAAALAAAAGLLPPDADGRFAPTRPATGAELDAAIARLQALATR